MTEAVLFSFLSVTYRFFRTDYLIFMKEHHLIPSMSRRGNCHDNAVAESFFATFKKRVTKCKTYSTREEAKAEIFNFIESPLRDQFT